MHRCVGNVCKHVILKHVICKATINQCGWVKFVKWHKVEILKYLKTVHKLSTWENCIPPLAIAHLLNQLLLIFLPECRILLLFLMVSKCKWIVLYLRSIMMTQQCLVTSRHCHFCPTGDETWPGHSADQQPGGAAAEGHRHPWHFPQKDDCTQHPVQAPLLPHWWQKSDHQ